MKYKFKIICGMAIVLILCSVILNAKISAEPMFGDVTVMKNVSANTVFSASSCIIDDLKYAYIDDYTFSRGVTGKIVSEIETRPYKSYAGGNVLELTCDGSLTGNWVSFGIRTDSVAVGRAESLICSVSCGDMGSNVYCKIVLHCDEAVCETKAVQISSGSWNDIVAGLPDVSEFPYIDYAEICFMNEGAVNESQNNVYYFDFITLSDSTDTVSFLKFLSDSYYVYGGTSELADNVLKLSLSGNDCYIESDKTFVLNLSNSNSIAMRLANNTGCKTVRMYYTTEDEPTFNEENSSAVSIATGNGVQNLYFPISDSSVRQLKFVFEGAVAGEIAIYSVSPSSASFKSNYSASVSTCKITEDKTQIEISGSIGNENIRRNINSQLYIYEIPSYLINNYRLNDFAPVCSSVILNANFDLKYTTADISTSVRSFYVAAIYQNGTVTQICEPTYISNPEILSNSTFTPTLSASKKGIAEENDTLTLSISNTCIDIYLDELISLDVSEYYRSGGGVAYYYDSAYVKALDKKLTYYYSQHVSVSARILIKAQESDRINEILLYNTEAPEGIDSAWNVYDLNGVEYICSALSFLAERYSGNSTTNGKIDNYIIGSNVTDQKHGFFAGSMQMNDFAELYANALRLSYNVLKSMSGQISVYASVGNGWEYGYGVDSTYIYDNRTFLENLNRYITYHGNFGWNLVYNPYPENSDYTAYNGDEGMVEPENITMKNIEVLYGFLSKSAFYFNGEYRNIILAELKPLFNSESKELTADYIYSYCKISSPNYERIKAYIVNRNVNYSQAFKYIDTYKCEEKCAFALNILGINGFDDIVAGYDISYLAKRKVIEKEFENILPSGIAGSISLFSYTRFSLDGWTAYDGCKSVKYEAKYQGYENLMEFSLYGESDGTGRGIICNLANKLDLSSTSFLQFYIQLASMPEEVETAGVQMTVYSGQNYTQCYSVVQKGKWVNLVFDISDFDYVSTVDKLEIKLFSVDGNQIGEPAVFISEIVGISREYSGHELEKIFSSDSNENEDELISPQKQIDMRLVYTLIGIIIVTMTIWIMYILSRLRTKNTKQ